MEGVMEQWGVGRAKSRFSGRIKGLEISGFGKVAPTGAE